MLLFTGAAVITHREEVPAVDPHAGHIMPKAIPMAVTTPAPLPRTGWTAAADSSNGTTQNAAKAIDNDPATTWRSGSGALPHTLTLDTKNLVAVSGLTYLPPQDAASGRIGQYRVSVSADNVTWTQVATGTFADDAVLKTVSFATVLARYVRLIGVTEAGGRNTRSAAAEVHLLGGTDPALPRTGWVVTADSQEAAGENGLAANAIDGNTATIWHTQWQAANPPLPHTFTVDMGGTNLVSGLGYLPRQDASRNGTIGQYRVETSTDGLTWGAAAATGSFADVATAQTVTFDPRIARYVRLTALTEAGGRGPWSSAAEINLLGRANPTLARTGWTVTASDQETASENGAAGNVLDGNPATIWHSRWSPAPAAALPHSLTVDLKTATAVGGLTYLPRPGASGNGRIGAYRIESSTNGTTWTARLTGASFADNPALQTVVFPPVTARYFRLIALSEAGSRGPWSSAAEINLLGPSGSVTPRRGSWSAPVGFPLVPVAAAQLPNGKILTWSAFSPINFGGDNAKTLTATYDPATGVVTQREITQTGHDMFCPGISVLPDGRIVVTGGSSSAKTSLYDPANDSWTAGPNMTIARGYQSSTTLSDGRVFTIGGSWSGPVGGTGNNPHKYGEVYAPATGWTALPDAKVEPMLTADANQNGDYRKDNHAWLFAWSGGRVLQAGPSRAMNWYTTTGTGGVTPAGVRADDVDAMNGNAVMYDAGKILTVGGAPSYEQVNATGNAYQLTVTGTTVAARKVAPMAHPRAFHNSVALPDGKVVVFGGQAFPVPFSDNTAVLSAEMWDPATEQFTTLASGAIPRTYHSVALLMPDARVFVGGGGLCGNCTTNHLDAEIFTPPYLLDENGAPAVRPIISTAPANAANGADITVTTNGAVESFAIVRMGTATHSVDTDQRRIALEPVAVSGGGYRLTIPADPGIALPGYWMLFALDAKGVPSISRTIRIG